VLLFDVLKRLHEAGITLTSPPTLLISTPAEAAVGPTAGSVGSALPSPLA